MTVGFTLGMKTSLKDTWTTPQDFFATLHAEFNFALDAAALSNSTLVPDRWFGPDHPDISRRNAFDWCWAKDSGGQPIYLNPPYGRVIGQWMAKANEERDHGATVVCLVPARTDTRWWHDYCIHHEIRFIKGRLKFGNGKHPAPFPSAVIIMR